MKFLLDLEIPEGADGDYVAMQLRGVADYISGGEVTHGMGLALRNGRAAPVGSWRTTGEGEVSLVYRVRMDRSKLDEYARGLYDGPPHDPVQGEPEPGRELVESWRDTALAQIANERPYIDTVMWDGQYVEEITVEVER